MYQYQYQYNQHSQFPHSSYEAGQLRSMSSMSTMNSETDSNTFQHSTSSAQTSTNSSPYNHHKNQQYGGNSGLQQPSIYEEHEGSHENSPDLMNTEFYSSDNIADHKNHAQNFRQSMVFSDSMDSQQFKSVRDSIYLDPSNQEPTKLAMTNSPSFSALAQILEKKSKFKPSTITSTINEDEDVFTQPSHSQSSETLTIPAAASTPTQSITQSITPIRYTNNYQEDSPNLIQLDDTEASIPRDISHDSILPSPMDPDTLIAPQFYERMKQNHQIQQHQSHQSQPQQSQLQPQSQSQSQSQSQQQTFYAVDDIFKTPEVPQMSNFKTNEATAAKVSPRKYASMLDFVDESVVPEIIPTPVINSSAVNESPRSKSEEYERPILVSHQSNQSNLTEEEEEEEEEGFDSSKPLPKLRLNTSLASPQYKQRSSSLPVLTSKPPQSPSNETKTTKEPKKKNRFISLFKSSKRSVSTSQVEQTPKAKQEKPKPKGKNNNQPRSPLQPVVPEQKNSPQLQSPPHIAKKSTSSTSLFDAFKRKNGKNKPTLASKSFSDIPNIQINNNNNNDSMTNNHKFSSSTNDIIKQVENDDSLSISTIESAEFNEDFNTLNVDNNRPTSQISNSGDDVFPKSLNPQEIESIVSLERNRSIRSRHSTMSQRQMSLSDAISLNAHEEGMYVTQGGKEPSIPDLHKSPSNSVLKKQNSMSSFRIDDDLEFGEDLSTELEFDNIADSYEPETFNINNNNNNNGEDGEDASRFMEFANFIDFGGDLELNFDFEEGNKFTDSPKRTLRPSVPSPRLQPPLSTKPFNSPQLSNGHGTTSSPLLESPILQNEPFQNPTYSFHHQRVNSNNSSISASSSPALQPLPHFIQEQTSRPISMSFKGLRAPAFVNNKNALTSSSSFVSQNSSSKAPNSNTKKVGFSSKIVLYDAWNEDDYDRHPDVATCNQLTPMIAQQIKEELNELKREMEIHEDSECYTHFY